MQLPNDFTDDQKKTISDVNAALDDLIEDQLQNAYAEARERLAAAGVQVDPDSSYCHLCLDTQHPCYHYIDGFMGQCKRYTCRHHNVSHNHPR